MSKINDLISAKKEVTFKEEKFTIDAGFTLEETPAINKAFGPKSDILTKYEGLKEILKIIVKRLYPDATEDEISKVDAKHSADLLEVFYQLDDTEDSEKERIQNIIKKRTGK